jgi:cytochrome oxidase Cu insertion factor (SCO1/SenC/PrrC family)
MNKTMPTDPGRALARQPIAAERSPRPRRRRWLLAVFVVLLIFAGGAWGLLNWFVALQNRNVTSGIAVGAAAPDFSLPDQHGRQRTLHDLMGPKGLLLVFVRSADW